MLSDGRAIQMSDATLINTIRAQRLVNFRIHSVGAAMLRRTTILRINHIGATNGWLKARPRSIGPFADHRYTASGSRRRSPGIGEGRPVARLPGGGIAPCRTGLSLCRKPRKRVRTLLSIGWPGFGPARRRRRSVRWWDWRSAAPISAGRRPRPRLCGPRLNVSKARPLRASRKKLSPPRPAGSTRAP